MNTTNWTIDPAHSRITFRVKHLMISAVNGEFKNFSGNVSFDPDAPENTTLEIVIEAASIDTKVTDRDNHLRSPDFLDVETYPEITFKSTGVALTSERTAKLNGELTIGDQSKPVALDVEMNGIAQSPWGQTVAGFSGTITIDRHDWGLTWNQALETGGVLVGQNITIGIELELIKETAPEATATD